MHIMTIVVVCYWPDVGFSETCNKFSCSMSPKITKKKKRITHTSKNYYSKEYSIKHVPSKSQILDQTPTSVTCLHVIEGP